MSFQFTIKKCKNKSKSVKKPRVTKRRAKRYESLKNIIKNKLL